MAEKLSHEESTSYEINPETIGIDAVTLLTGWDRPELRYQMMTYGMSPADEEGESIILRDAAQLIWDAADERDVMSEANDDWARIVFVTSDENEP